MAVTVGGDRPSLEVNIVGVGTYEVPLLYSLSPKRVKELQRMLDGEDSNFETFTEFFGEYIPEEAMERLSMGDMIAILNAWTEESGGQGVTTGESLASPSS